MYTESTKVMGEGIMAMQETKSRITGAGRGAAFAILGLAGLVGMEQITTGLVCVFSISLKMTLETLPSILLAAWHILQSCAFGHLRLLEGLLQVSVLWQFLTLAGA